MTRTSCFTLRKAPENSQRKFGSDFKTITNSKRLSLMLLSLTAALFVVAACGSGDAGDEASSNQITVSGQIIDVQAESFLDLDSVTLIADDGRRYVLEGRGRQHAGFLPSHLREHMVSGGAVTVAFHEEDGALVLDSITD
jgi:hypothetical protein